MARIDYHGIKEALKKVIIDANLDHPHSVSIEGDILFDGFDNLIDIEIESRSLKTAYISSGTKVRFELSVVLMVWTKNFDKSESIKIRDELISELEPALMRERTLNGKVDTIWLTGGQNIVAFIEDESAFVAAGEIRITIESEIIT